MKLYATTTSERATKGQGGNKFIDISLSVGSAKDSKPIARIVLASEGEYYRLTTRVGADERAEEIKIDGNGQRLTDEECRHDSTRLTHDGTFCADCNEELNDKGKQQKGEDYPAHKHILDEKGYCKVCRYLQ